MQTHCRVYRALAMGACVLFLVSACGPTSTEETQRVATDVSPSPAPEPSEDRCIGQMHWTELSTNRMVHGKSTAAGIIGEVQSVSEPRWNSEDGQPWQSSGLPEQYRWAQVLVQDVLFRNDTTEIAPDDEIEVLLRGDGTPTGCPGMAAGGSAPANQMSGDVVETGTRVLWVLRQIPFPWDTPERDMGDGEVLTVDAEGAWNVREGVAESLVPGRSVPEEELAARLRQEHREGRQPNDRSGWPNPLDKEG